MKKVTLVSVCGFVLLLLIAGGEAGAQVLSVEIAKELWEQAIAAKGGRDQLYQVRNMVVTSQTKYGNGTKTFHGYRTVGLYVLPDKWWEWYDDSPGGFGRHTMTFNFTDEFGWELQGTPDDLKPIPPDEAVTLTKRTPTSDKLSLYEKQYPKEALSRYAEFQVDYWENQFIYLMETKWLRPVLTGARIERSGSKKFDVVEATWGRERIEFYLDQKTHLPAKIVFRVKFALSKSGEYAIVFVLDDYVEVNGLKLPSKVARGKDKNETTYQLNVDYDEGLFTRPPVITDGPDAWQPKKPQK
jgi:hypothetical protein